LRAAAPTIAAPLALSHTWPLWEQPRHFELGHVLNSAIIEAVQPPEVGALSLHHSGCWECDLTDDSLTWSGGVYDIFGLPRDAVISRKECIGYYREESRAKMERLRANSIRHRRGFPIDVEIRPVTGQRRWMRLIAAPVCVEGRSVRLHGLKLII
jgi:PAS domain-containing protein